MTNIFSNVQLYSRKPIKEKATPVQDEEAHHQLKTFDLINNGIPDTPSMRESGKDKEERNSCRATRELVSLHSGVKQSASGSGNPTGVTASPKETDLAHLLSASASRKT